MIDNIEDLFYRVEQYKGEIKMKITYNHYALVAALGFLMIAFLSGNVIKFGLLGFAYIIMSQLTFFICNSTNFFKSLARNTQFVFLTTMNVGIATMLVI